MDTNLTTPPTEPTEPSAGVYHNPEADKSLSQAYEAAADFMKELELEG